MIRQFTIHLAQPEIENYYKELEEESKKPTPDKEKIVALKKLKKTFNLLSLNPRYPSLNSHEISDLTKMFGIKIFESYIENNTPAAGRVFWIYGPLKNSIVIVGIEPHPNDKNNSYKRIKLSLCKFN